MINDNTILSSFDDRPTLLEWLKKVEDALKTDTATAVSVENPSVNTYVFKITFADGTTLSSGNVVFPDSVKDVSIKNGHIIVTSVGGNVEDLGVLNPYAETIVENAETNTTEIGNNVEVGGDLSVQGSVVGRGIVTSIGRLTANGGMEVHGQGYINGTLGVTGNATIGGRLQADSSIISNGEIRGGNISGTKFLLGTEEMPLVKANPTGEATQTLSKLKVGDTTYGFSKGKNIETIMYTCNKNEMVSPSGDYKTIMLIESASTRFYSFLDSARSNKKFLQARIIIRFSSGNPVSIYVTPNLSSDITYNGFEGVLMTSSKMIVGFGAISVSSLSARFVCSETSIFQNYFENITEISVEYTYLDTSEI